MRATLQTVYTENLAFVNIFLFFTDIGNSKSRLRIKCGFGNASACYANGFSAASLFLDPPREAKRIAGVVHSVHFNLGADLAEQAFRLARPRFADRA